MNVLPSTGAVATSAAAVPGAVVPELDLDRVATDEAAAWMRRELRRWVGPLADADSADDLTLAVYEALANVVDHAYVSAARPGRMRLRASASPPHRGGRDVTVVVADDGTWRYGTDPGYRGRGLPMVRTLVGSASVLLGPGGTTVRIRKRVAPTR